MYTYVYICIEREMYVCIYVYIYICGMCICMCMLSAKTFPAELTGAGRLGFPIICWGCELNPF